MSGTLLTAGSPDAPSADGRLCVVTGANFSGRTTALRRWVGLGTDPTVPVDAPSGHAAYVGPEIYNCISGLAQSVIEEIRLHTGTGTLPDAVSEALSELWPAESHTQNPTTLSGGEQSSLAILSAAAMSPHELAIDCALEQIDGTKKSRIIAMLRNAPGARVLIADNRLDECEDLASAPVLPQPPPEPPRRNAYRQIEPAHLHGLAPLSPCELGFENLRFAYKRGRPVLQDVSARLAPGQIYWLGGSNGSGKSTLAKLLCGALRPGSGAIFRDGRREDPWRHPGGVVAYHFQNPDLQLFETTVARELTTITGGGHAGARMRSQGLDVAHALGLQDVMEEHPLDLPFSMRKRVALAATLAMRRPWTILDEPTLGQDSPSSHALAEMLRSLATAGAGVIVISHSTRLREELESAVHLTLRSGVLHGREND